MQVNTRTEPRQRLALGRRIRFHLCGHGCDRRGLRSFCDDSLRGGAAVVVMVTRSVVVMTDVAPFFGFLGGSLVFLVVGSRGSRSVMVRGGRLGVRSVGGCLRNCGRGDHAERDDRCNDQFHVGFS